MSSPYVAEVEHQIGADHRPQSGRFQLEERNRKFQEQVYLRNCRNASGNACVRRTRLCSLQVAVLVFSTSIINSGHGLQCYTTPDICETEKGYGGGCIEDVGVAIGCAPGQDSCRSVLRAAEPSYYFINKTCTSACERQDATDKVIAGKRVSETVDCCYSDLCNARNLPMLSAAPHAFPPPTTPWLPFSVALGGLCLQWLAAAR